MEDRPALRDPARPARNRAHDAAARLRWLRLAQAARIAARAATERGDAAGLREAQAVAAEARAMLRALRKG